MADTSGTRTVSVLPSQEVCDACIQTDMEIADVTTISGKTWERMPALGSCLQPGPFLLSNNISAPDKNFFGRTEIMASVIRRQSAITAETPQTHKQLREAEAELSHKISSYMGEDEEEPEHSSNCSKPEPPNIFLPQNYSVMFS